MDFYKLDSPSLADLYNLRDIGKGITWIKLRICTYVHVCSNIIEWEFERDLYSRFKMAVISFYKQFKPFSDGFYPRNIQTAFNYVYKLKQIL